MFARLGAIVARHWLLVIAAWALLTGGLWWAAPRWDDVTLDGDLAYLPADATSIRGEALVAEAFPHRESDSRIVVILRSRDVPLGPGDDPWIDIVYEALLRDLGAAFPHDAPVARVWSPNLREDRVDEALGRRLRSADGRAVLLPVLLTTEFMAVRNMQVLGQIQATLDGIRARPGFPGERLELGVCGPAAIGADMLTAAAESVRRTEMVTVLLVLVILLAVYRAPLLAAIPLVSIAASVLAATNLVALLAEQSASTGWYEFKIFTTTRIFVVVILFGAGTDFCLFLISRYREELSRGLSQPEAVARALDKVGAALCGSALTTIAGLGMLFFGKFGKFHYSGPSLALCLAVALAASVTLAPALLRAAGGLVFWPGKIVPAAEGETPPLRRWGRFWEWVSHRVVAHPGWLLLVSLAVLAPFAWRGLRVQTDFDLLAELDSSRPSVRGTAMLREHFPPGYASPLEVLIRTPDARFGTTDGKRDLGDLAAKLSNLEGVAEVRSWATPFGGPPTTGSAGVAERAAAEDRYIAQTPQYKDRITRLDLVLDDNPFSPAAAETLARVQDTFATLVAAESGRWRGAQIEYLGTTASTADLREVTTTDRSRIQAYCVVAVLAVLLVILRRPLVCVYLILSVLFSYLVAVGATQWVFALAHEGPFAGLDWKVPLFLFVILVAVGEDYNIYLTTRVFEEQRRLGPREGLRTALARTGGIITSCGVIMAGTFVSMMSGSLRGMLELGFALSLGVLLDTFVVRTLLVPAFLALLAGQKTDVKISPRRHGETRRKDGDEDGN